MKVAILTQPLGHNYGGLLQAYALQVLLNELGAEVETLDRREPNSRMKECRDYFKYLLKLIRGRIKTIPTETRKSFVLENLARFRTEKMNVSPPLDSVSKLASYCEHQNFDAYLVGSDQVWRPRYSPCLENFFLDFTEYSPLSNATRMSYAASFGVDNWELSDDQTAQCRHLIHRFDAVSVRERSAVSLCQQRFGVEAEWVLDPTLLLSREHYEELTSVSGAGVEYTGILYYLLDESREKLSIVGHAERVLKYRSFSVKPTRSLQYSRLRDMKLCQYPSVENWVRGFQETDFVITDSFHGTIFAIIFNKPFIAIGNRSRGLSRFESLLSQLDLSDRLVTSADEISDELLKKPINWNSVNQLRRSLASESRRFLTKNLNLKDTVG